MAFWRRRKDDRPPLPTGEPVEFEPEPRPKPRRGLLDLLSGTAATETEFGPLKLGPRDDPDARRDAVRQAAAVWRERYVKPFMGWFGAQVPSNDAIGPGGLRHAGEAVWDLARFYVELYAWHELGFAPPEARQLREDLNLRRRDFEIIARHFQDRYPRVAQEWQLLQFPTEAMFWEHFRKAARGFERGRDDGVGQDFSAEEQAWVSGLTSMMSLAVSWAGYPPPAAS